MSTLSEDFQIQVTAEGKSGALKLTEVDSWGHQQLELTPDVNDGSKFRLKGGVLTTGDNSLVGRRIVEDRSLLPKIMVAGPQNSVQEIEYHVRPDMTLETVRQDFAILDNKLFSELIDGSAPITLQVVGGGNLTTDGY